MMGEWEKFFTLHCYLLHQRNSSFPGKMQSRKINRLEAEEDLVEVVYRVCDGKKYTQIFLKLCLGIAVFLFLISQRSKTIIPSSFRGAEGPKKII